MNAKSFIQCLNINNLLTMPPKRAKKAHHSKAILNAPRDDEPVYPINLPSPLLPPLDCLPSLDPPDEPEPSIKPTIDETTTDKPTQQEKVAAIKWTAEMIEALVECIYRVWKDGRAANNGFKKEAWVEASIAVTRVYQGPLAIEWDKCKNKWTDLKEKWKHWLILLEMSSFGWDEGKKRYKAHDYVWESLNKS
jgi:Myb/SANT-like DNA-binding domain